MSRRESGHSKRFVIWKCLVAGTLIGSGCLTPPQIANAQNAHEEILRTRSYDVAAAELGTVLIRFAEQAGIQLSVDVALTRGKYSRGIKGDYTLDQALRRLLDETGLAFRMAGPRTIVIEKLSDAGGG